MPRVETSLCTDISELMNQANWQQFPCYVVTRDGWYTHIRLMKQDDIKKQKQRIINAINTNKRTGGVKLSIHKRGTFKMAIWF